MKNVQKLLAVILGLALLVSAFSVTAFAAGAGTQSDPLAIEYNSMLLGYLMNDKLEAGDEDGIWYTMEAYKPGIMYVEVRCSQDISYEVEVTVGGYTALASESNPVITYPVSEGDTITVHKYVKPDGSGNIPAGTIYAYGIIVAGNVDEPLNMIATQIKVPVAAGASVTLTEKNNKIQLYGKALIVSGPAAAIKKTNITFNSKSYTDVDCDGTIEMGLPGNYESRPPVTITNNSDKDTVYTFNVVTSAAESDPPAVPEKLPGDMNGDDEVTNDDVVILLWNVLFPEANPLDANTDLNGDGSANNDDVVLLMWHTLFPEENPL